MNKLLSCGRLSIISILILGLVITSFSQSDNQTNLSSDSKTQKDYSESGEYNFKILLPIESKKQSSKRKQRKKSSKLLKKNEKWLISEKVIENDASLVSIPITVYDRYAKSILDLRKEELKVFENGIEQKIKDFGKFDEPHTIIFLLDTSPSIEHRKKEIEKVLKGFIEKSSIKTRIMIVSFHKGFRVILPPTNDKSILAKAIKKIAYRGGTSIYSAVTQLFTELIPRIGGRKSVVLFSDGVDTTSGEKSSYRKSIIDAQESNAVVYSIYYNSRNSMNRRLNIPLARSLNLAGIGTTIEEYKLGRQYMHQLTYLTGGRLFNVGTNDKLQNAFETAYGAIQTQRYIKYFSNQDLSSKEAKRIKVRLYRPNMTVHIRNTYFPKRKLGDLEDN